jgi:DNA-binding MarR family transcriptional regulator
MLIMLNKNPAFVPTFQTWIETFMSQSMRGFACYARGQNLSMSQISALFQLNHRGGLAVSQLSEGLGVSQAAASQLLDRLVQQGLVTRQENPKDRREKLLVLTEKGQETVLGAIRTRESWLQRMEARMTPEELEKVSEALEIMIGKMNQPCAD